MRVWLAGRARCATVADPRESIQAGVTKLVNAELPKEQAELYDEECRKRTEFEQKVAVDNLVAKIDKRADALAGAAREAHGIVDEALGQELGAAARNVRARHGHVAECARPMDSPSFDRRAASGMGPAQ